MNDKISRNCKNLLITIEASYVKNTSKTLKDSVTTTDYVSFTGDENKYFDKHRKVKAEGPNMDDSF